MIRYILFFDCNSLVSFLYGHIIPEEKSADEMKVCDWSHRKLSFMYVYIIHEETCTNEINVSE